MVKPISRISQSKWIQLIYKEINSDTNITIDFWDTICELEKDPIDIRIKTCSQLIEHYKLDCTPSDLHCLFNKIASGLQNITHESLNEGEYSGERTWFYVGLLIFTNSKNALNFSELAIRFELENFNQYSRVDKKVFSLLDDLNSYGKCTIVSDFEYSDNFIRNILILKGILWKNGIHVSSVTNTSKYSGSAFRSLNNDSSTKWIHVGDNRHSDCEKALQNGFESILIKFSFVFLIREVKHILRLSFLKFRKCIGFFALPISNRKYLNFLYTLTLKWKNSILECVAKKQDTIVFVGSEGAFASQLLINCEVIDNIDRLFCTKFGRMIPFKATIYEFPLFSLAKMLLDKWSLEKMCNFFAIDATQSKTFFRLIMEYDEISIRALIQNREQFRIASELVHNTFPNFHERILIVDIGYQGSFAHLLKALGYRNISLVQLFGKYSIKPAFGTNDELGIPLRETDIQINMPFLDSDLVEGFFSLGPRSPKTTSSIYELKTSMISTVSGQDKLKLSEIKLDSVLKFLRFPPYTFARRFCETIFLEDDLNPDVSFVEKLPWSAIRNKGKIPWFLHLNFQYLKKRVL